MVQNNPEHTLSIDNTEFDISNMSDRAKAHLASIQFVDEQLQQLSNEWAVADTARIGYTNALKSEISKP